MFFSEESTENDNSLVVISLSKVGGNEFFHKVESSYCHYLEMLNKLQKNKRNDLYIFLARRDVRKLTCLTAKFQEKPIEPLPEITWLIYCIWQHTSFAAVKNVSKKAGCQCFTADVMQTSFQQVFSIR